LRGIGRNGGREQRARGLYAGNERCRQWHRSGKRRSDVRELKTLLAIASGIGRARTARTLRRPGMDHAGNARTLRRPGRDRATGRAGHLTQTMANVMDEQGVLRADQEQGKEKRGEDATHRYR
jgi:hypothetical protein